MPASSDDVFGEDSGDATEAPARATPRLKRAASKLFDDHLLCHLCEDGGDLLKTFKEKSFHRLCWNAVRCHRRVAGVERADRAMANDTKAWREEVLPLVADHTGDCHHSRAHARRQAKEKYSTTEKVTSKMDVESDL